MTKVISGETMVSNVTISAQVDSKIEEEATAVLAAIALTPSDAFRLLMTAFRLLMTRVAKEQSFPQELFVPNAETISALEDVESGRVISFANLQEFMDDLHADNFDFIKFGFDNVLF